MSLLTIRRERAFTLVELLVVMVIVSLLVTIIMQGFAYSLGIYQRVVVNQKNAYVQVMAADWFRSSLATQVAPRSNDKGFQGSATAITTQTFQPLLGDVGSKSLISWQLMQVDTDLGLYYKEGDKRVFVYSWENSSGWFEYLDDDGGWQRSWPLDVNKHSDHISLPPLPKAIKLVIQSGNEVRNILVKSSTRVRADISIETGINDN